MRRTSLVVALLLGLASLGTTTSAHADGTGVLEGVVTDARTGQPVSGISVSAISDSDFRSVQTDSDGRWSLELASATYRVGFQDFFSGTYREQWAIGKADQASADPISVADGSDQVIDVALQPFPTVSGRITDNTGAPIAGFCPSFVLGDPAAANSTGGGCTDADGRYTQAIRTPGTYRAHFKDYVAPYADQWYRGVTNADDATTFEVTETSAITGIDAVLQPQATITTSITDTDGAPLRGCATAYDLQGRDVGNGCSDYDSAGGPVTITGLPAGTYVIRAEEEWNGHHVGRYLGGATTAKKKATRVTVATGEAKTVAAVALPLGGSVTGIVRDAATGEPIENACVTTTGHYDGREAHGYGSEEPGTACTDATGRYTVWALESGSYPVEVADAFGTHANLFLPSSPDSRGSKTYKVVLGSATVVDAALVEGGSISGRLTMADGGAPDYTCVVAYAATTHEQIGRPDCADSTGAYTITGLGTNDYKLEVYDVAPGYAKTFYPGVPTYQKASTVTVTAGETVAGANITVPRT